MPDLGLEVLLKGSNMLRLLQGLWVALRISLIAVVISIPLGLLFGVLMTRKNVVLKAIFRVYLEFIRIMPQLVLLFLFYFSTTRTFGWNLSGETASIIVFVLWGTAEMSDLVRGALISIPKHQYESSAALGLTKMQTYLYVIIPQAVRRLIPLSINSVWNLSDRIFIVFYRMLANQYACKISGKEMEVIFLGTDIVIYRTFEKKL